jgi:hypothetical protein
MTIRQQKLGGGSTMRNEKHKCTYSSLVLMLIGVVSSTSFMVEEPTSCYKVSKKKRKIAPRDELHFSKEFKNKKYQ